MKVLGIDTATLTAGIAVVDDARVLAEARHDSRSRSADLLVAIDDACRIAGVTALELDAIAIGAGPGSFTGLRIGMATAKGIAFAAHKPLWAVSSLAALAWDAHHDGLVCAALDARRGELFAGCFRNGEVVAAERVIAPGELAAWAGDAVYVGDAVTAYPALAGLRWLAPRTPSGVAIATLALAGGRVDITTSGAPMYIRPSEAEVKYPDGVPGALRRR